jgi:oligoendopeptidase F
MHDQTWNLTPLAAGDTDPRLAVARQESQIAVEKFAAKWQDSTDFLTNPQTLRLALEEYEQLQRQYGLNTQEYYYYQLRTSQDQLSPELKAKVAQADEISTKLVNQIHFFAMRLSKLTSLQQQPLLQAEVLQPYHHFLSRLFAEGQYTLSEPEEKILNLVSQPAHSLWVQMTSTFLAQDQPTTLTEDGSSQPKTLPELFSLSNSRDQAVRDAAANHIHHITAQYAPTATAEVNAILTFKKTIDQLRHFDRPDQARHLSDDIDSEVVDAMLTAVEQRFDLVHRYYQLKAALLGKKKLAYHERNIEVGEMNQKYTYDQALKIVGEVFTKLDPQFKTILERFVKEGQIDVYPRPGKSGGAFCAGPSLSLPTYVLLNHTDQLTDVLTLAHEMGHAINNELMRPQQNALNYGTPLATAEVASTFMEDFVLEHVAGQSDPQTQLAINMMKLNDDISSIFRQVAAYRFEQELHHQHRQEGYLSQQKIGQLFTHHMSQYMGPAVEQSDGSANWWVYWSHFRNFFYVYSYASGLLISKSLQSMVRQKPDSIKQVKEFLAAGTSASPANTFANMGINITQSDFWQRGLGDIENLLHQTEQLAHNQHRAKK